MSVCYLGAYILVGQECVICHVAQSHRRIRLWLEKARRPYVRVYSLGR